MTEAEKAHYLAKAIRIAERAKAWREANPERVKKYATDNKERIAAQGRSWREANPERNKELQAAWRAKNADRLREQNRERQRTPEVKAKAKARYEVNREKYLARARAWRAANVEKARALTKSWIADNGERMREHGRARRDAVKQATPPWADMKAIREIYEYASFMGLVVDHIHPIKGRNFSGLHVPWNLRVVTREENERKKNKLLPEFL